MKFDFDYWNEKARDHVKGEYVVPKEKCLMGGMLMKRGNSNKTWKSRYFVLYHGLCFYFKSADTKYPIGGFTIFNAKIIPSVAGEGILRIQPECSYSLKNETKLVESRERTFFLQGENEELDSWCLMLHKEKDRIEEAAKRKKEKQVSMQLGRSGNLQRGSAREKDEKSPTEKSPLASPRWVPAEPTIDTKIVISRQLSALKMSPRASSASSDGSKSPRSPRSPQSRSSVGLSFANMGTCAEPEGMSAILNDDGDNSGNSSVLPEEQSSVMVSAVAFDDDDDDAEDPFFGKVVPKKRRDIQNIDSDPFWSSAFDKK